MWSPLFGESTLLMWEPHHEWIMIWHTHSLKESKVLNPSWFSLQKQTQRKTKEQIAMIFKSRIILAHPPLRFENTRTTKWFTNHEHQFMGLTPQQRDPHLLMVKTPQFLNNNRILKEEEARKLPAASNCFCSSFSTASFSAWIVWKVKELF